MKTPYLLGIITALLFGSFAVSGFLAEAGPQPIETIQVDGLLVQLTQNFPNNIGTSIAECPTSHPFLIGGSHTFRSIDSSPGAHIIIPLFDTGNNAYQVSGSVSSGNGIEFKAHALCANFNFPASMMAVGGVLFEIDTWSLFIGAIGVNPVITGLVAITMGGVAAQVIWYVNSRRIKSENS